MSVKGHNPGKLVREMTIVNTLGMHARPAALFAKVASKFDSEITIERNGVRVSGKSVIGLLSMEAAHGTKLIVEAEGSDAREALEELAALVSSGFGEYERKG